MPNSLLGGKIQGTSPIRACGHLEGSEKAHEISFLRANSLRFLTGNFLRPCRELNRPIREVSAEIRESRFRPLLAFAPGEFRQWRRTEPGEVGSDCRPRRRGEKRHRGSR